MHSVLFLVVEMEYDEGGGMWKDDGCGSASNTIVVVLSYARGPEP
jgi:hypothetical protein